MGIKRPDGRVATRNYVAIVSSVNCSAHVSRHIAEYFDGERLADYPNIDGVIAITHQSGCGMASTGEPVEVLRRVLGGYATHANVHSTLMIGLGCEANQINDLLAAQGLKRSDQLQAFTIQDTGGTRKTIQDGIARIKELLPEANKVKRETCPGQPHHARPAVRGVGRLQRDQREPCARRGSGHPGAQRRDRDPVGDARDLWRRAFADAPRRQP